MNNESHGNVGKMRNAVLTGCLSAVWVTTSPVRAPAESPSLTVYNQNFAVVRESVPLDLKLGISEIDFTDMTAHVEPDSVVLRDPAGKRLFAILEQNYRADPISQGLLLNLYEGQTIDFVIDKDTTLKGKILRSGYVPHVSAFSRYGQQYQQRQMAMAYGGYGGYASEAQTPIIEVDGLLRFGLPGQPIFPALSEEAILKPTIHWMIESAEAAKFNAELAYITGGMSWQADYNVIAPVEGDHMDLVGWVTIDNQSGKSFENARIKLMAGDVSKIQDRNDAMMAFSGARELRSGLGGMAPVTEKTFDEYHLYTLNRSTTLRDRQTKQVEFLRAGGIESSRIYVYDGARIDWQRYQGWSTDSIRQDRDYGTQCNKQVWVMREFVNSQANHLGVPLPRGRLRFYRRNDDGQIEFTGENLIHHTPKDETVRVYTGNAFDLIGERKRTDYKIDAGHNWLDETFEIVLRNHKTEPVEIRVVENLYRWVNWEIQEKSDPFEKTESQTIEFRVTLPPDGEKRITYRVHYSW